MFSMYQMLLDLQPPPHSFSYDFTSCMRSCRIQYSAWNWLRTMLWRVRCASFQSLASEWSWMGIFWGRSYRSFFLSAKDIRNFIVTKFYELDNIRFHFWTHWGKTQQTDQFKNLHCEYKSILDEVWWLRWLGSGLRTIKVLGSIPSWGKKKRKIFSFVFCWLLLKVWDLPLRIHCNCLRIHAAIITMAPWVSFKFGVDHESERKMVKKTSSFQKMCASPCYYFRKQLTKEHSSFNFSHFKCAAVTILNVIFISLNIIFIKNVSIYLTWKYIRFYTLLDWAKGNCGLHKKGSSDLQMVKISYYTTLAAW